jgi:hypothetical protein
MGGWLGASRSVHGASLEPTAAQANSRIKRPCAQGKQSTVVLHVTPRLPFSESTQKMEDQEACEPGWLSNSPSLAPFYSTSHATGRKIADINIKQSLTQQ